MSTEPSHENLTGTRTMETVVWSGEYHRVVSRPVVSRGGMVIGHVRVPQRKSTDVLTNHTDWEDLAGIANSASRGRAYSYCLTEMVETILNKAAEVTPPGKWEAKTPGSSPGSDGQAQVIAEYYARHAFGDMEETGIDRADQGDVLVDIYAAYGQFTGQTGRVPDTIFLSTSHLAQACRGTAVWSMSDLDLSSLRLTKILGMRIVEVEIERPMLALSLEAPRQDATSAVAAYYHETRQ